MQQVVKLSLLFLLLGSFVTARADWLDQYIPAQIKQQNIPGLSLAVIRDGKVIKAAGYGYANLELKAPATPDTVYEIGSISKQFAAEAIMLLVEDGKLKLDDPINQYLPANAPAIWQNITIRNLLNHVSGLKDWTEIKEFSYRREYTAEEFIELVRPFPLQFQPNDNWSYSNTNLPLIGIIVERAAGKPYEEFVSERIFRPLGFPSIRFRHQEEIVTNRATGYVLRDNQWKNGEPFRPRLIAPSGGVLATAVDLARWWEAIMQGRLLKPSSLAEMLAPARLNDGRAVTHGFAFFTDSFNGHKMIFHHGSTVGGFGSVVRYFPQEKLTLAIIGNLEDGGFGPEVISKRVANFYIPGAFVGGLKETPDATPNQTQNHLQLLKDIAGNKDSALLAASYAPRINDAFRKQLAENLKQMKTFAFLGQEKITADHFVLDPTLVEVFHYKMTLASRTVYYHFRLNREGKAGFIVAEE